MEKINVNLYGGKSIFGGKETPLRAEIIYCDKCESCELYKDHKCLNVTRPFSQKCKFGKVEKINGYTSRSSKHYVFKEKYKNDEKYDTLEYPQDFSFAEVGEYYVTNIKFVEIKWNEDYHKWDINTPFGFGNSNISFIPKEEFTLDLLKRIVSFTPRSFFGDDLENSESVNNFLVEVSKKLPDLFEEFVKEYPEYGDIKANYVGRYAYINTMVDGSELVDVHGNKFTLKDGYIYCDNYKLSFLPFNSTKGELKIEVTDKMIYKITDNNQVDSNTKFK